MSFTIPATMFYDGAKSADSVTYQLEGHTPAVPKIIIFDRKVPTGNAPKEQYRVRYIGGSVDAQGALRTPGIIVELSISSHMAAPDSEVIAGLNAVLDVAKAEGFATMAVTQQRLPRGSN